MPARLRLFHAGHMPHADQLGMHLQKALQLFFCCRCRVVAPDLRAHGLTHALDGADFSAATLAADVVALWQHMFGSQAGSGSSNAPSSVQQVEWQDQQAQQQAQQHPLPPPQGQQGGLHPAPPTVLVGHSMGGAIAVHAAALAGEQQVAWGR